MTQLLTSDAVPERELLESGHLACPGCGAALAMRFALKALGEKTIVTLPACCWSIIAGPWPQSSLKVPLYHTAFETGASVASGIKAALLARGDTETTVIAWAGDGGTFDIGLQALSGAAERNEDILYVCYDNEAYMNTGIQRSSATPFGAWTTTTPGDHWKAHAKKDILAILAAHRIPYAASASVGYPEDLIAKVTKARNVRGTRFLHVLAPCPPGWKSQDEETIELARAAVRARVFPLVEVEDGERWRITLEPPPQSLRSYLERQGRFRHLTPADVETIQRQIDARWDALQKRVGAGRPAPAIETPSAAAASRDRERFADPWSLGWECPIESLPPIE
jgi:pyruvate ferredoxin oxidoreductase beta subunit/2-oxoisovalerate ferredoxin oxidoreductase beta subunit